MPIPPAPRVLLIIACLHHGGTEVQTLHTARALVSLGCQVHLLCLFDSEPAVQALFESAGASVKCLALTGPHNYPRILWRVSRAIRSIRPAIAHVQYIAPGLLSVLAARLARVPRVLVTVHQVGSACTPWEHRLFRVATRLADLTLCVSHAASRSWFHLPSASFWLPRPGRHSVLPNAVELAAPASQRPARQSGVPYTIGYVGRIRREKGVDLLIRAAASLANRGADFRLLIVGDGPQKSECVDLAASLGLHHRLEWRPFVPPDQLPALYGQFDVLAVPSRLEGFGLVAAEAMGCGVPVVAARTGGLPEIVQDRVTGLLFTPGDPADLASCLGALISDPDTGIRFSSAARRSVVERFSFQAYTARLAQSYALLPR